MSQLNLLQSRNREDFGFKLSVDDDGRGAIGWFQSRNREAFGFKFVVPDIYMTYYTPFQSRNREAWLFKLIDKIAAEVKSMKFRSRNRDDYQFKRHWRKVPKRQDAVSISESRRFSRAKSSYTWRKLSAGGRFRSRNRDAFSFQVMAKSSVHGLTDPLGPFQSRNQEELIRVKTKGHWDTSTVPKRECQFQSRNREAFRFKFNFGAANWT